jgi:hypothetical protein
MTGWEIVIPDGFQVNGLSLGDFGGLSGRGDVESSDSFVEYEYVSEQTTSCYRTMSNWNVAEMLPGT